MKQLTSAPLSMNTWQCPACLGKCTCVRCRKERDEAEQQNNNNNNNNTPGTHAATNTTTSANSALADATTVAPNGPNPASAVSPMMSTPTQTPTQTPTPIQTTGASLTPSIGSLTVGSSPPPALGSDSSLVGSSSLAAVAVKKEPTVMPIPACDIAHTEATKTNTNETQAQQAASANTQAQTSTNTSLPIASPLTPPMPIVSVNDVRLEATDRCVYILRGLPGSGKSFLTNLLVSQCAGRSSVSVLDRPSSCVCSADYFFSDPIAGYQFDSTKIGEAHAYCMTTFIQAIAANIPVIIVDNTNIRAWEWRNFALIAQMYQYPCVLYGKKSWQT